VSLVILATQSIPVSLVILVGRLRFQWLHEIHYRREAQLDLARQVAQ
jgi:hypothetical protein